MHSAPAWLPSALAGAVFVALFALERVRPLRPRLEATTRHVVRNLALGAVGAAVLAVLDRPLTALLAQRVEASGWGVLPALGLPRAAEIGLGLLLLDYTIFLWHGLLHRVPLLWRFHEVHHVDLDVDASTALRFHAGELAASVLWRSAQVAVIGIGPTTLAIWHSVLFVSVLFHHSNVRLPAAFERGLGRLVMTPRLHGLHHSVVPEEMRSNLSSGLTLWDVLHGTWRAPSSGDPLTIGVAAVRRPLGFAALLRRPFGAAE